MDRRLLIEGQPPLSPGLDGIIVYMYYCTNITTTKQRIDLMPNKKSTKADAPSQKIVVERVQTGLRLEKRLLKVLKGLAEYHDMTLGDLLEGIVLHAFDGRHPFGEETRARIVDLKRIYELDLDYTASHQLVERLEAEEPEVPKATRRQRNK
jgi:hypothetical protein